MITLRAHHLLCLQNFHGLGYNEKFIENMSRLASAVKKKDAVIQVSDACDDICKECPHMKNNNCVRCPDAEKNVRRHDRAVLKVLKLNAGDKCPADELYKKVAAKIFSLKRFCKLCPWISECSSISHSGQTLPL